MAIRQIPRSGNWELTVRHKKLLGHGVRLFFTFDTEAQAQRAEAQIQEAFAKGVVPKILEEKRAAQIAGKGRQVQPHKSDQYLSSLLAAYRRSGKPSKSDDPLLVLLIDELSDVLIADLSFSWAEAWVDKMKIENNYAPGTIRKRIGVVSRCLDWWLRKNPDLQISNPIRLLPRGAASYNASDAREVEKVGGRARRDEQRDRRLRPGELERIEAALAGVKRDDRERPLDLPDGDALPMLFWLILHTGLRLREAYQIRRGWVNLEQAVINLKSSKQWYGREKWRTVPIQPDLRTRLTTYLAARELGPNDLIFPFLPDPATDKDLDRTTCRLSQRFRTLYTYAGCEGITEHDLRHEATCRWYEMRDAAGGWLFRETEIEKIMGWEPGSKMPARYASFRAEDLAQRMYVKQK